MTPPFSVRTTPHYERLSLRLFRTHPEFGALEQRAKEILSTDPYNRSHSHPIAKLTAFRQGEGQYRIRLGRFRFVYDIYTREVVLQYCDLRREQTYRR